MTILFKSHENMTKKVKLSMVIYSKYMLHGKMSPILNNECLESLKWLLREKLQATSKELKR